MAEEMAWLGQQLLQDHMGSELNSVRGRNAQAAQTYVPIQRNLI